MPKRKGRKRKGNAQRHPSGQVVRRSYEEREADVLAVVVDARVRLFGVSQDKAKTQEAGHALGREWLRTRFFSDDDVEKISAKQVAAAELFEKIHRNYSRALMAKNVASAGNLDRQGGHDSSDGAEPDYVARCSADERAYVESRRVLLDTSPLALFAVETWVLEDKQAWSLLRPLRLGLNALVRLYKIEQRANAA